MPAALRFGLIGVGRWGKVYIRTILSLKDRCLITHLGTSRPDNAGLLPHPVRIMADWRNVVHADCDAVIIATPPSTHADILEACLEAGKPCIVEKPLCLDVATAEHVHQHVKMFDVPVLVNHTQLFNPAYITLRRIIQEGKEPVRFILSEESQFGPFRAHTPTLWDWCPHDFSLCLDLLGQMPVGVSALGGPLDARGDPELVSVRLNFPMGACAWIQAGRLSLHERRTFSVFTDTHLYVLDNMGPERLIVSSMDFLRREAGGVPEDFEKRPLRVESNLSPMQNVITYFLNGLAGGDHQYFGTDLALDVVRLLERCDTSLRQEISPHHSVAR